MMKKFLFLLTILSIGFISNAQTKGYLKYDSLYLEKSGGVGNAELILENASRNVQDGVLVNKGNGRTEFRILPLQKIVGTTDLFQLPSNFVSSSIIPLTKYGATASATVTTVGSYDQIAVGGDASSVYEIANRQSAIGEIIIKYTVRIDSLGAVPLLGLQERAVGGDGVYSNFGQNNYVAYANLLTGAVTSSPANGSSFNLTTVNNLTSGVSVNDIVDIYLERLTSSYYRFSLVRRSLGKENTACYTTFVGAADISWSTPSGQHCYEGFILAGGKYTILDYKISTPYCQPKLLLIGDSYGSGAKIPYTQTFTGQLNNAWPYKAALASENSCMLSGMVACSDDIVKLRPQYVILFHVLDNIFYGNSDSANVNFSAWDAKMKKLVTIIKQNGALPIFIKFPALPTLDPSGVNGAKYAAWVDKAFPTDLVLDMRNDPLTTDATHFHPDGNYYGIMVTRFLQLVKSNNL